MLKKNLIAPFVIFLIITQLACNIGASTATPNTFATLNGLYTSAAQTQGAGSTSTDSTATPGLPVPTGTPASATATIASKTPVPVSRCDAIEFLDDITYPDGSLVTRNNTFAKVWRVKNIGTCAWTPSYAIAFVGGDLMNGPSAVALTRNINPGETIDLQVTLTAPNKHGNYRGYWKLRNASGMLFGFGPQADTAFWVDIRVAGTTFIAYSFADNYCSASWENNSGSLPCPGTDGDSNGYVIKLNKPEMENGADEDEPGLLTVPPDKFNGIITGQYPAFTVQAGDRFRTIVNCQYESTKCDVVFRLDYKNNGQIKTLASWHEIYEGEYYPVDLDLSSLAGETVKFILVVSANGGQKNDYALWLNPYIVRQGVPTVTPTPTFTLTPTFTPTFTPTVTATFTATVPTNTPTETPTATTAP
jgi:hypothetical protein